MNRQVKFRVYKSNEGMVTSSVDCYISIDSDGSLNDSSFLIKTHVMQFTGLTDKNGVEIYEGDILQIDEDWDKYGIMAGEKREIYFKDGCFRFKPKRYLSVQRGHILEDNNEFEVIGNIHQNPELLDQGKAIDINTL